MRKFYTTLALTCALGASAFAAAPVAEQFAKMTFDGVQTIDFVTSSGMAKAPKTNAPAKVATSAEDVEGFYDVDYKSFFQDPSITKTTGQITAVSDDQLVIQLEPWCSSYSNITMDPLVAEYDASTGTITILRADNSSLGTYTQTSTNQVYNLELNIFERVPIPNDPDGKYRAEELDELIGVVQEDGTIVFGDDNTCWGFQLIEKPGSYVGGFMGAKFVAPDFFKFNADEWESAGEALFTEDWMNLWLYEDDPDYVLQPRNLELMRNIATPTTFLVKNPFNVNNWLNEDPSDGYLVFSLENHALVPMRPLTPSGLWLTIQQGGFPQQLYLYNQEGYFIYNQGYSASELAALFQANDIVASDYDENTKTVTLRNLCFGYTDNPGGSTYYPSIEDGVYKIKADGFEPAGVNSVYLDESNGPVRYFNLQGVEIANPAAGELVIVKEGNKTSKTIVR